VQKARQKLHERLPCERHQMEQMFQSLTLSVRAFTVAPSRRMLCVLPA
jgi:hypothetical protein